MKAEKFIAASAALFATLWLGLAASSSAAQAEPSSDAIVDRLEVPGPIRFGATDFHLAWSVKNLSTSFKQEYLPQGESVENYRSMVLLEVIVSNDTTLQQAVAAQVRFINERKKTDPVANMSLMAKDNGGDIMLDFVMQARNKKGELIIEWNAYRYRAFSTPSGSKGVALFAISKRAYGETESMTFLKELRETRKNDLNTLAASIFPAFTVGNSPAVFTENR